MRKAHGRVKQIRRAFNSTLPAATKPIARKSALKRGGRVNPVNKSRRDKNWLRTYGSEERVAWVKALPCVVASKVRSVFAGLDTSFTRMATDVYACRGDIHNSHVEGGGASRKASANRIVPMCEKHHRQFHDEGRATFEKAYGLDLHAEADLIASHWQSLQPPQPPTAA